MVTKSLIDFSAQKNKIVYHVQQKVINGNFSDDLHEIFNRGTNSKLKIDDVELIIESIELKLRKAEIITYTYFESEYDGNILTNNTLLGSKIIDTEFSFSTRVFKNRIEIIDAGMYSEVINQNFQSFILTISSLYENITRLIETLIKKRVVFGDRDPHVSTHLKVLISYWDNLIELGYRSNEDFYNWLNSHRLYLNKYLETINRLRNSYIHGYSVNLKTQQNAYRVINFQQHDSNTGLGLMMNQTNGSPNPELEVNNFVNAILNNSILLVEDLLRLFERKLSHHMTKIPLQ